MKIQFTFGNLKWLTFISYLLLMAGIIAFLAGTYDFIKIQNTLELQEKFNFFMKEAILTGLNGLIFFLLLNWFSKRLHEKQFKLTIQ